MKQKLKIRNGTAQLSRDGFVQWLRAHDPQETVGIAVNASECPLARYIKETFDVEFSRVSQMYLTFFRPRDKSATEVSMPFWADRVIATVDSAYKPITAGWLLSVMNDLEPSLRDIVGGTEYYHKRRRLRRQWLGLDS